MAGPTAADYNAAIQNLRSLAGDHELRGGEVVCNHLGIPMPYSGNFADVYQVRCARRTLAVKCFTRKAAGLHERYRAISSHLKRARLPFMVDRLPFMVDFDYVERGLRIGGNWHPVLKMDWVEGGLGLNEFVDQYLEQPKTLRQLLALWVKLADRLREAQIAHADLQHGNVLLVPVADTGQLSLKLIDYDGMHVPSLAGKPSGELGHPCYQHPQRLREGTYSAEVDRFSHLVIYCALESLLVGGRPLWERFNNQENLLFREADFAAPGQSALFQELWEVEDPNVRALVGRLLLATQQPLDQTPLLQDILGVGGRIQPLTARQQQQAAALLGKGRAAARPMAAATPQLDAPVHFQCSGCGQTLRVPSQHAGKQARCSHCQTIVTVPTEGVAQEDQVAVAVTAPDQWYVQTEDGGRYGPITREQLDGWVLEGRLTSNAQVLHEGGQWRRADDYFPQLQKTPPPSVASPFAGKPDDQHSPANPYQTPFIELHGSSDVRSARAGRKAHRGGAVLILGIMALMCNCCFIPGICAWVMGTTDLAEMRYGRMDPSGRSLTQAGHILGIIGTVLHGLVALIQVLAAAAG